jgi:hypothetical protein
VKHIDEVDGRRSSAQIVRRAHRSFTARTARSPATHRTFAANARIVRRRRTDRSPRMHRSCSGTADRHIVGVASRSAPDRGNSQRVSRVVQAMSSQREQANPTPLSTATDEPLTYWWPVCRGQEIMRAFHAAPEPEAWRVVEHHPALLLPELVDAAERVLGPTRPLEGLREMHHALRGSPAYAPYHRLLAIALVNEQQGSRRVNLERALAVIQDVRRAVDDPADARAEHVIRAELAALIEPPDATPPAMHAQTPTPEAKSAATHALPPTPEAKSAATHALPRTPDAKPPATHALFLDEIELAGFRRGDDRRGTNPNLHDRAYTVQGGLAAGSAEWLGDDAAPVYRIVEARWVFASSRAAKAYLDAPATQLLARDGMANPAVLQIADGAHAWGSTRATPRCRSRHGLLFRIDRVVARLDITEGPNAAGALQTLKREHLLPYADAVVRRVRRVLAEYWLAIGRGAVAAQKLVQTPARKVELLFAEYPILLLPAFPIAMAALGDAYRPGAEQLAILQGAARNNWRVYREILRALVRILLDETAGEPRINADAALRLVSAHRRLDADPAWTALEAECSARAAGKEPVRDERAGKAFDSPPVAREATL